MSFVPEGLRRPFRYNNYRIYFIGQIITMLGVWMYAVANSWLVYKLTDSSLLLGVAAFSGQIPFLLFGPVGGHVADAFERKKIIFCTQSTIMILAFIQAGLTLAGLINVWEIMILSFAIGIAFTIDGPARQALVVEMVGRDELPNAIALNSSVGNAMRLAGPMLAGALIPLVGEGWCFFIQGMAFFSLIITLFFIHLPQRVIERSGKSPLADIRDGLGFSLANPGIRTIMLSVGGISLLISPLGVLLPIFVGEVLDGSAKSLGMLMGASGLGSLVGALALAARTKKTGILLWVMIASVAAGVGTVAFSLTHALWPAFTWLVLTGYGQTVILASFSTLLQVSVPDKYLGRVMALFSMMLIGVGPIGALIAGAVANVFGAPYTFVACGVGLLLLMAAATPPLLKHMRGVA